MRCTNCASEIGFHTHCAVCGAPAPKTEFVKPVDPPAVAVKTEPADLWRRMAAAGIDLSIVFAYWAIVCIPLFLLFQLGALKPIYDGGWLLGGLSRAFLAVATGVVPFAWGVLSELARGQTPGKRVMGIRISSADHWNAPLTSQQLIVRGLIRIPSFLLFGLGYMTGRSDKWLRAWHDKAAETVVVDVALMGSAKLHEARYTRAAARDRASPPPNASD